MKITAHRSSLLLLLLLLPLLALPARAGEKKSPLPLPQAPVLSLTPGFQAASDQDSVASTVFTITSPDTGQFANAASVDWLAVNSATRASVGGSLLPAEAATIVVNAADLEYADGHVLSFSLVSVAAADDPQHSNSARLIFCFPVHEDCQDPETLVRALPPPVDASISLLPAAAASARAADSGTFEISVPLRGAAIANALLFSWTVENSNRNAVASGQQTLGPQAQTAALAEASESIEFGAGLVRYAPDDALRITLRTIAGDDGRYADSHAVTYFYCNVQRAPNIDCAALYADPDILPPLVAFTADEEEEEPVDDSRGNCLNNDVAAPIVICADDDYAIYTLYGINQDSSSVILDYVSSSSALLAANAVASTLASGTNSATGKAWSLSYNGSGTMTLSTYYADKAPDVDKPYVITIDNQHRVTYLQW